MKALFIILNTLIFGLGCNPDNINPAHDSYHAEGLDYELNQNIQSIQRLVKLHEEDKVIDSYHFSRDQVVTLRVEDQAPIVIVQASNQDDVRIPSISIVPFQTDYYWQLGKEYLMDRNGEKIKVTDEELTPSFQYAEGRWLCLVDGNVSYINDNDLTEVFTSVSDVNDCAVVTFPSQYQLTIPLSTFHTPDVPQKAFYKDVFLDAGIGLTSRNSLAAASYLGLSLEGVSFPRSNATMEDSVLQNDIIQGNDVDHNGRLLYPDGQPRYRLLFVNGGSATTHGKSLTNVARQNMRQFVGNGGSYVGTCAGAFFATNGYDGHVNYPYYLSLWPSLMKHTGLSNDSTGMFVETDSPLLYYYDFGADYYVSNVRHNKGGYPVDMPLGTEIHARYDYPNKADVHQQPCLWSYKASQQTGRVVMEGSHPEEVKNGERRDLTAAMLRYAMDGVGNTTIKGFLQNDKTRTMDCGSEANNPNHAKLGDLQCHHFIVMIPEGAENISVCVNGQAKGDFSLSMNRFTFAYPEKAEFVSSSIGSRPSLSFSSLEPGLWYVCVQCKNTVETAQTDYGQNYSDPVGVLNGLPYQITASWQQQKNPAVIHNVRPQVNDRAVTYYGLDGRAYPSLQSKGIFVREGKTVIHFK